MILAVSLLLFGPLKERKGEVKKRHFASKVLQLVGLFLLLRLVSYAFVKVQRA
jgi:hypothetical protein